jgi:hypothetical protein
MRIRNRAVVMVALVTLVVPTSALAASPPASAKTVVIDGREYGPRDGLKVDTWQIEIEQGSGPVGASFGETMASADGTSTPMASWGSSYAINTESFLFHYDGKARAGGNIYDGLRIVQVCIWYTRGGITVSQRVCSSATRSANGLVWSAGAEKGTWAFDSADPWAPHTIFNYSLSRIRPGV